MKFSVAAAALFAAGAYATPANVSFTTEVVTVLTTYCPFATTLTHNGKTYTASSAETLTITDCPCTVTKPITTTSSVMCNNCGWSNSTASAVHTTSAASAPSLSASAVPTAGAGRAAALSGAGLAGVLGLAAFVL
jgi:hypothetical protein